MQKIYSPDYLIFFGVNHLPEKFHDIIRKIAFDVIPASGVLKDSVEIASKLNCSGKEVETLIDLLFEISPSLISKNNNGQLIFQYPSDEIKKVMKYRNAISNLSNYDDDNF